LLAANGRRWSANGRRWSANCLHSDVRESIYMRHIAPRFRKTVQPADLHVESRVLYERQDSEREEYLRWPERRQSAFVCQDKEQRVAKSLTTVSKAVIAFFEFIELFASHYQLYKRDERDKPKKPIRKFLFDNLRFPLLGFPHANGEIERNPY